MDWSREKKAEDGIRKGKRSRRGRVRGGGGGGEGGRKSRRKKVGKKVYYSCHLVKIFSYRDYNFVSVVSHLFKL